MITVHFARPLYLDIFTKTDMGGFWVKMCKIEHFLYFRRLSMSWCGGSIQWYCQFLSCIKKHGA